MKLTHYLLVSSAYNLCKEVGSRSGLTEHLSNCLTLRLVVFKKKFSKKLKNHEKFPSMLKSQYLPRFRVVKACWFGVACTDPEGGQGVLTPPPPLKNHKNTGFLSNTGPDPLRNRKATKLAFNVGPSSAHQ